MRLPWRRKALSAEPAVLEALRDRRVNPYPPLGGTNVNVTNAYQRGINAQYGWIYSTQPAVRSVVDFIARNAAQLSPPKLYRRKGDTERERESDHAAAELLRYPDGRTPGDSWFYRVFIDFLVWDNAFVVKFRPRDGNLVLLRVPPGGVTVAGGRFSAETYYVWNEYGEPLRVPPDSIIHWFGYHPDDPLRGLSRLETLRQELATDRAIQETMVELAKNGLKAGYIERPLDAPLASNEELLRIAEFWKAGKLQGDPILDEGMKYHQSGVTPKDAEVIASRKFTKEEVAAAYGVPPVAMGIGDADPSEQRKLVYADVLPPYCNPLACMLNIGLLRQEFSENDLYYEFDLNEKLRGDITERFSQYTAATGAPWLLRNEVRARENLPPVEDGDELIVPLNVVAGEEDTPALPAPNVMPIQDPNKPPQDGSYRPEPAENGKARKAVPGAVDPDSRIDHYQPRVRADMARQRRHAADLQAELFKQYKRQESATKSAKAAYDEARWNREMAETLGPLIKGIVHREGDIYVARLGGAEFDTRQVANYLDAMVAGTVEGLTAATARDISSMGADKAFQRATQQRAAIAGAQITASATYFGRKEGALQAPQADRRLQRWVANTDRHADLDGTAVPIDSDWGGITPGSTPNCGCAVDIA